MFNPVIYKENNLWPISIQFKNTAMQKVVHINQKRGKCALLDKNNDERKIKYPFMIKVCKKTKTGR